MATDKDFADFIVDQIQAAGIITCRKMFGEYCLYCDGKVVALICDNQLFVKPTEAGKKYIGTPLEAPAYPGAKMSYLIQDKFEDRDWITTLIKLTASALPEPKIKKSKRRILLNKKL